MEGYGGDVNSRKVRMSWEERRGEGARDAGGRTESGVEVGSWREEEVTNWKMVEIPYTVNEGKSFTSIYGQ